MSTLAFALAATIKHDGRGGVADLLATPTEAAAWLADNQHLVTEVLGRPPAGPEPAGGAISGTKLAAGGEFLPKAGESARTRPCGGSWWRSGGRCERCSRGRWRQVRRARRMRTG